LLAIILLALLIGCDSSRPDPEEVITKAQLAIEKVETYRIEGTSVNTEDGETNLK